MACNHTYRDYTKMTVEEMVSYIVQDGKIQSTFSEDNYRDGALACSRAWCFRGQRGAISAFRRQTDSCVEGLDSALKPWERGRCIASAPFCVDMAFIAVVPTWYHVRHMFRARAASEDTT